MADSIAIIREGAYEEKQLMNIQEIKEVYLDDIDEKKVIRFILVGAGSTQSTL